ncbi:UDP-N-acetylmuramoyl-tripeptide--D-alanyl-D-alanine ligase [Streptomyces mayteni]
MVPLSLSEIAAAVRGTLTDVPDPAARVWGPAVFDSRRATPGSLFVALGNTHSDAHAYARAAVAAGAVAVLAARRVGAPAVLVGDVRAALPLLGHHLVRRLPATRVVGITGSAGKTTTKDLVAALLSDVGPTVATDGNANSTVGLAAAVSRATTDTHYLVLEMGARGVGRIRGLTSLAPPRIAVVTNVGTAHLGEFGGRDRIAEAKGELVEALPAEGLAVLNADDPLVRAMAGRTGARVIFYGQAPGADLRAEDVELDAGRPRFTLRTPEGSAPVRLRLLGRHHVANALAAACVAREAGLGVERTAVLLSAATARSHWRMETHDRPDGVTVINDAYNANPDAMRASLTTLAAIGREAGRRTFAVLGAMGELGDDSRAAHEAVGALAGELGIDHVVTVGGPDAAWISAAAGAAGVHAVHIHDQTAALATLDSMLRGGDVVLVKASRGARLQKLAAALLQPDTPHPG